MSYALLIGGSVAAIGAGIGAYSSYQGAQQQKNALQGLSNAGYQTPDYSGVIDYLNNKWTSPSYQNYSPVNYTTGLDQFMGQSKYVPRINRLLNRTNKLQNKQYQAGLYRTNPYLQSSLNQYGQNVDSWNRGEIPADVVDQIQRNTAEQSLFGGYGNSGMARNLTARDLGLTSLDIEKLGASNTGNLLNMTQSLNPYHADVLNYLMTPQQLLSTEIGQQQFANQVYNQNQSNFASNQNQRAGMIANLMQAQEDVGAQGANTQNLLNYQSAMAPSPYLTALSGLGGSLSSLGGAAYGALSSNNSFGSGQYPQYTQYGGTYGGTYNNLPVYRPQLG